MSSFFSSSPSEPWGLRPLTGILVLGDGFVLEGYGVGFEGVSEAEVCFNTAMTGYQEILSDPSYCGQIVTFTFPHIGNVGANDDDIETVDMSRLSGGVVGAIFRQPPTSASSYRSAMSLSDWLILRGIIGLYGIDTRALTTHIRESGLANGVIAHSRTGDFDIESLKRRASSWSGLEGCDLVPDVTTSSITDWHEGSWRWSDNSDNPDSYIANDKSDFHIVAMDFGIKRNILRLFSGLGCRVSVVPSTTSAEDIMSLSPDGLFLSNGPGDPAATGEYVVPELKKLLSLGLPIFGICLGHQILALALGGKTIRMHQGHHGANHPVKDTIADKVEIVSMNHGFAVDSASLPSDVIQTHVSLFDGSNCGLRLSDRPVFSVQHHPEASPGPQDSYNLFSGFVDMMRIYKSDSAKVVCDAQAS